MNPMNYTHDIFLFIDIIGMIAFAISGALVGIRNRIDISGICVLAFITGNGGGTMRDLIIGAPVFWTQHLWYVFISIGSAIAVFLIYCFFTRLLRSKHFKQILELFDALGLVTFAIAGASKALAYHEPATVAVLMGTITAVGGGMLRDVFARETPMVFKSQMYATPALVGSIFFVLIIPYSLPGAMLAAAVSLLFLRLMGIYRNWHLPFPKIMRR